MILQEQEQEQASSKRGSRTMQAHRDTIVVLYASAFRSIHLARAIHFELNQVQLK